MHAPAGEGDAVAFHGFLGVGLEAEEQEEVVGHLAGFGDQALAALDARFVLEMLVEQGGNAQAGMFRMTPRASRSAGLFSFLGPSSMPGWRMTVRGISSARTARSSCPFILE